MWAAAGCTRQQRSTRAGKGDDNRNDDRNDDCPAELIDFYRLRRAAEFQAARENWAYEQSENCAQGT